MRFGWKIVGLLLVGGCVLAASSSPVMAASQSECAIWLCLPGGFPNGCGAAHSAMEHRIDHMKPPLPPFSECSANHNQKGFSYRRGFATFIPRQKVCDRRLRYGEAGTNRCVDWKTVHAHWAQGKRCIRGHVADRYYSPGTYYSADDENRLRCSRQSGYISIYQRGQQYGNTFYFNGG